MSIRIENGFYVDENNNKWSKSKYTLVEAQKLSNSLIECYECIDCEYCIRCAFCVDCENCIDCEYCFSSSYCRECYECLECDDCERVQRKIDTISVKGER